MTMTAVDAIEAVGEILEKLGHAEGGEVRLTMDADDAFQALWHIRDLVRSPKPLTIHDPMVEALADLVGLSQLETPPLPVVRCIAEGAEALLRCDLRRIRYPNAVQLEGEGEPDGTLVVPLYGDDAARRQVVQQVVAALEPVPEGEDSARVAAELASAAVALTLEYGLPQEQAEGLIRLAISEGKRGDADCFVTTCSDGHEVITFGPHLGTCAFPDTENGHCGAEIVASQKRWAAGWIATARVLEAEQVERGA